MKKINSMILAALILLTGTVGACSKTEETKKRKKVEKKEEVKETQDKDEKDTEENNGGDFQPDILFTITDRDGNTITESVFAENELTIINFWEPWCGPCVGEMPELETIYEDSKSKGVELIGVYSTDGMEEDVEAVLADAGITYPICMYVDAFAPYQSGYVPTTIFVDKNGHVITMADGEKYIVGSNDYDSWAALIENYL